MYMWNDIKKSLIRWNDMTSERQKLQHCYLVFILVSVVVAGIVSLIDADLGHDLVKIALVAIATFVINAFVWNLINSVILTRVAELTRPEKPRKR
jgi:undecaprenyl pyrophosphate phosphatase UppP